MLKLKKKNTIKQKQKYIDIIIHEEKIKDFLCSHNKTKNG